MREEIREVPQLLQSDARIDLLITDVGLPGGLNGRQVTEAARPTPDRSADGGEENRVNVGGGRSHGRTRLLSQIPCEQGKEEGIFQLQCGLVRYTYCGPVI